ncbi:hypothetical protein EDD17DRAFT_1655703 [Pisolithus thermaeus]|nr:hypothetical protein EDD17DRAFT_1655703 [Pisolithus thermaeus]
MVIMLLCQAVITLRVWYLFSRNACVRTFIVGTLCGSIAASCALLSPLVGDIDKLFTSTTETTLRSPEQIMWLFVPSVTNHSILFVLKVYRFMQSGKSLHMEPPMRRFLKEGMLMYAFAMGSLVSTIVRLSFTAPSEISIYLVALARWASYLIKSLLRTAMLSAAGFFSLQPPNCSGRRGCLSCHAQHTFVSCYVPCRSRVAP